MQNVKKKQIKSLNSHKISSSDKFFLDTNIWIYLLNEKGTTEPVKYSKFLTKLLTQNAKIIINQEVISEVLNRFVKNEYKKHKPLEFKTFRKTQEYRDCYRVICALFNQLIDAKVVEFLPIEISLEEFKYYIEENTKDKQKPILDYKDYIFDIFAAKNKLILVTNDGDFSGMRNAENILSANPRLIGQFAF